MSLQADSFQLSLTEPLLRPDDAAALLSVKTSWIYEAVRSGSLPCLKVGRHIRFTRPMLEEWLATRTIESRRSYRPAANVGAASAPGSSSAKASATSRASAARGA